MIYERQPGVPEYESFEIAPRRTRYCVLIPVINEGARLLRELDRAAAVGVPDLCDVVICDGGSTDGSTELSGLAARGVGALLVKRDSGRQGAQLRMGISWALARGYEGIITVDGNDKDSVEDIPRFADKLDEGYDFIQGSRFIRGGQAVRTPLIRYLSVRLLHAPVTSIAARHWFTDTTNAFRGHSAKYLRDPRVQPLRDVFQTYELLAYLSVRAAQLGLRVCEVPVSRVYPEKGKTPTKISFFRGNSDLLKILFCNLFGAYRPKP